MWRQPEDMAADREWNGDERNLIVDSETVEYGHAPMLAEGYLRRLATREISAPAAGIIATP